MEPPHAKNEDGQDTTNIKTKGSMDSEYLLTSQEKEPLNIDISQLVWCSEVTTAR